MSTTTHPKNTNTVQWISATDLPVCASPDKATAGKSDLKSLVARAEAQEKQTSPADKPCRQQLALSFFFDGTGNNKDADAPLHRTSNVARLHEAHINSSPLGIARIYVPGVGTPFPEVGDKGGAFGDALFDDSEALKGHNGWAEELRVPPSVAANDACFTLCLQG